MILCSFSHDPGSGLARVFFEVVGRKPPSTLERFLYRLSVRHRDSFVLKGALLRQLWTS